MLRSSLSRIRLIITALGCMVLGVSFADWAQTLQATETGYAWVGVNSSSDPAIETAEIWEAPASCQRPFFVRAALQSNARLKAHLDLAPEEVRAGRNRSVRNESFQPAPDNGGEYFLVSSQQAGDPQGSAQLERGAMLHVQYAEWYAKASTLEMQTSQWEQRLANVADQKVILSEATRRSFGAYTAHDIKLQGAKSDFEHYVLFLLGLGGFSSDLEQALAASCVSVVSVKKIFQSASYLGEIWRWPFDHMALFALGLELVLVGLFFTPIAVWIVSGDRVAIKEYARKFVADFSRKFQTLRESKLSIEFSIISSAIQNILHPEQTWPGSQRNPLLAWLASASQPIFGSLRQLHERQE